MEEPFYQIEARGRAEQGYEKLTVLGNVSGEQLDNNANMYHSTTRGEELQVNGQGLGDCSESKR